MNHVDKKNMTPYVLCKRNVYFHNEHIQYFILNNIKSAICIQTTAMYSTKVTAYLNIKRKWLQNFEVTHCDRCHVTVTSSQTHRRYEHKSLTAMSLMTSLSRSHFSQKVQNM